MNGDTLQTDQPAAAPRARPRRWLFRLAAIGIGLIVAAGVAELGARVAGLRPLRIGPGWQDQHRKLFHENQAGSLLPYSLKPGTSVEFAYRGPPAKYAVNADGLRADRRYARPKPAGVKRVVLLGDSVTFGLGAGLKQTFASRLERSLPGVEVINGGVGGYNTYSERRWLEAMGLSYEPDAIAVCYCPNDSDDPLDHFSAHTRGKLGALDPAFIPNPEYHAQRRDKQQRDVAESSRLKTWLAGAATTLMQWSALAHAVIRPLAAGGASRTYERCLLATAENSSPEIAWLRREFVEIHALAGRAPVYFAYVPMQYELRTQNATYLSARRNVEQAARDAGFTVVDVTAALERASNTHIDVTHLSPAGHAAVAAVLADALRPGIQVPATSPR